MLTRAWLLLLLASLSTVSLSAAPARADLSAVVLARGEDGRFAPGPVQARLGEPVELRVVLIDGREVWSDVPVRLRRSRLVGPLPEGTRITWLRVEPEREHVHTPSPNPGMASFSNAVLTGPDHGDWIGLDTLEYRESDLSGEGVAMEGSVLRLAAAHPTDPRWDRNGGAGSIWIAARVSLPDGSVLESAGVDHVDHFGLRPEVMRVSFRTGDDYLGWLSTYFNVPDVFGSVSSEVDRYTGADCADVLVAGRRASGERIPYVSVAGLSRVASPRSEALLLDAGGRLSDQAAPGRVIAWGSDVMPGDLLTIDYGGEGDDALLPRAWDHIGALVRDDGDGVLDGGDVLRHMGLMGLVDEPLTAHGPIRLRLFRFR